VSFGSGVGGAAMLLALRRSLGVEGEVLHKMGERIADYSKKQLGVGADEDYEVDLPRLIEGVRKGEDWRLRVAIIRDRENGEIKHYLQYGPLRSLKAADYSIDPTYVRIGVLEIYLSELLGPVLRAEHV